jgi:glycosyltransferase involved in cell wall biosynthesis
MRVLMLAPHPHVRGPLPKHTPLLVAALRDMGCTVLVHPWGQRHEEERFAVKIRDRARDVLQVRRATASGHFDVVVVKSAHDPRAVARDIPLALALRAQCSRIVVQFHGTRSSELVDGGHYAFKAGTSMLLSLLDATMVLSSAEQRELSQFRPRPPAFVVKNPFAPSSDRVRTETRSSLSVPQLLFVGRLVREKGIFDLLEALARALERAACHLAIVGDGDKASEVRRRIRELGIERHVTLRGYLSGSELLAAYREADLFVLPSWSEGFPTVIAEAMNAALPVVTTRIRGAADHLQEGEHALFVAPRDTHALTESIIRLVTDEGLRSRMGAANRKRLSIFSPDVVAREYLDVLTHVVEQPPAWLGRRRRR